MTCKMRVIQTNIHSRSNLVIAVNAFKIMYEQFFKCICIDCLIITDISKYC